MRRVVALLVLGLVSAAPARAEDQALSGPAGASASKVLVIGIDGTRFDLVKELADGGELPRISALAADGFAVPSPLEYTPPEAATLSEVGWSTIATGVWPRKHGVRGYFLNNDPNQDTKNGFPDFLTRIEQVRPALSTFLASDWGNIGLHVNGGPIFGDRIDARFAIDAPGTIEGWDSGDQRVADVASRYLREAGPDAGFVYLGVVDEVAHLAGSATPRYLQAIRDTDRRVGQMIDAIRARPDYLAEQWTIVLTTDHGQQNLDYPSVLSHGLGSDLERTSFVAGSGFGIEGGPLFGSVRVVDIVPTALTRLGISTDAAWSLDGRPFATAPVVPAPVLTARRRGRLLTLVARATRGAPGLRTLDLRARSAGRPSLAPGGRVTTTARRVRARVRAAQGTRRLRLRVRLRRVPPARIDVRLTDATGRVTTATARVAR